MSPLEGTRILDLGRYAPGPYASLVCAHLGAEVIKVESPPGGDPLRALDGRAFERLNAGKKSVVLDLKSAEDLRWFRRLLPTAAVLIESFRPGVMTRLGLDYESVATIVPRIVYVSISGYGQTGPYAHRAGHDVNYVASAGGLAGLSKPLPMQIADFAAGGLFGVIAILAALMERSGRHIDLSMHEGVLSLSMLPEGPAADALSGRDPGYGVYATHGGGALSVGALEPKFWKAFTEALGRADLTSRRNDPKVREDVAAILARRTAGAWEDVFSSADACVEPVLEPRRAFEHPQAVHRGHGLGAFQLPFGATAPPPGTAPALGEHTDEILGALG